MPGRYPCKVLHKGMPVAPRFLHRVSGDALGATDVASHRKGREFIARISGRLRRSHVKVIPGDHVTIAVSLHDPTHGLIVHRG